MHSSTIFSHSYFKNIFVSTPPLLFLQIADIANIDRFREPPQSGPMWYVIYSISLLLAFSHTRLQWFVVGWPNGGLLTRSIRVLPVQRSERMFIFVLISRCLCVFGKQQTFVCYSCTRGTGCWIQYHPSFPSLHLFFDWAKKCTWKTKSQDSQQLLQYFQHQIIWMRTTTRVPFWDMSPMLWISGRLNLTFASYFASLLPFYLTLTQTVQPRPTPILAAKFHGRVYMVTPICRRKSCWNAFNIFAHGRRRQGRGEGARSIARHVERFSENDKIERRVERKSESELTIDSSARDRPREAWEAEG